MKQDGPKEAWSIAAEAKNTTLLRLYIAGGTPASNCARANLAALCELGGGRFEVDVVDILREPLRALSDGVLVTPTLIRLLPLPVVKIVGDLNDRANILNALGLTDMRSK